MIRLDVLPAAQRVLWSDALANVPRTWVLYDDTAIALHLGHRQSVDFDFFSSDPLDRAALRHACSFLDGAPTLQDEPDTLTVALDVAGEPIKLSFFGGIPFGRVGEPLRSPAHPPIASLLDLLGTKLATVTQRIEARDYVDIAALLRSGLTLDQGVAAMLALYGTQASALQSVKTLTWFRDGDLETVLPDDVRTTLHDAVRCYDPTTGPAPKLSARLD